MRRGTLLFVLMLLVGLVMAVLGFALSAPIGAPDSPAVSNPRMDFAPLVFVAGVILIFTSAAVYEIVSDR
jgi:hypothetical protein